MTAPGKPHLDQHLHFTLPAADGIQLFVYRWLPSSQPRAVVQIVHGLAEHAARYARLAQALTSAGYAVYANDHRGHGRTAKSSDELGIFAAQHGWQKCMDDLWQLNRDIAARHPGVPIFMLGHSMGAALAEQFMGEHGDALAGVVLSASGGKPTSMAKLGWLIARAERLRLGARGQSKLIQSFTFEEFNRRFAPARTAFDWLSRDPAEVDKYVSDPFCGFVPRVQLWVELLDATEAISSPAHRKRVPKNLAVYVIAGSRDPVSGNTRHLQAWIEQYQAAGMENLQHHFYPEARHELFNEINRDEVTQDLLGWLEQILNRA